MAEHVQKGEESKELDSTNAESCQTSKMNPRDRVHMAIRKIKRIIGVCLSYSISSIAFNIQKLNPPFNRYKLAERIT